MFFFPPFFLLNRVSVCVFSQSRTGCRRGTAVRPRRATGATRTRARWASIWSTSVASRRCTSARCVANRFTRSRTSPNTWGACTGRRRSRSRPTMSSVRATRIKGETVVATTLFHVCSAVFPVCWYRNKDAFGAWLAGWKEKKNSGLAVVGLIWIRTFFRCVYRGFRISALKYCFCYYYFFFQRRVLHPHPDRAPGSSRT